MSGTGARNSALQVLTRIRTQKAWADAALHQQIQRDGLDTRDTALAMELTYGVLRNRTLLDYYLHIFSHRNSRIPPKLRDILRLGAYQIVFLNHIPDAAAVSEAVMQARHFCSGQEAKFCNALLRALAEGKAELSLPADYSIRFSHPTELVDLLKDSVGKNLGAVLEADNTPPSVTIQWNPLRGREEDLLASLIDAGYEYTPHAWLPHSWNLKGGDPSKLAAFQEGRFTIQDAASRLTVKMLSLRPGMSVLDACAAPGGKTAAAGIDMENQGFILARDIHAGKLPEIEKAAVRCGITIVRTEVADASVYVPALKGQFDAVLADVPCSGFGVIRRKPDIRWRNLEEAAALPALQRSILDTVATYVRPGGILIYSTCTILKRENSGVTDGFLAEHPEFLPETLPLPGPLQEEALGGITLLQGINNCDGFYIRRMRRQR